MYAHSSFFIVAALLVPVSISAACTNCLPSEDEEDMAANNTRCFLPDILQPPDFPDNK